MHYQPVRDYADMKSSIDGENMEGIAKLPRKYYQCPIDCAIACITSSHWEYYGPANLFVAKPQLENLLVNLDTKQCKIATCFIPNRPSRCRRKSQPELLNLMAT